MIFNFNSAYDGDPGELSLGDEVEFILSRKIGKVSAECLRKLPKGSVAPEDVAPEVVDGKILRCMRIINPDQEEYPGIVQVGTEGKKEDPTGTSLVLCGNFNKIVHKSKYLLNFSDENPVTYTYGITSLADKHDFLQQGDVVKFQIATIRATGQKRATRIAAVRKYIRANVDSVKGQVR